MKNLIYFCFFLTLLSGNAMSQDEWVNINQQVTGEELFPVCAICHGTQGQGNDRRDGPPLAGLQGWYIEKQLHNYMNGIRGYSEEDVPGKFMSDTAGLLRNAETISSLAEYITTLELGAEPDSNAIGPRPFVWDSPYAATDPSIVANASAGGEMYNTICLACHQADGSGNEALGAGDLRNLSKLYMERQLKYFRDGLRGSHPEDVTGKTMAAISATLTTEQSIADVVAYILSLETK